MPYEVRSHETTLREYVENKGVWDYRNCIAHEVVLSGSDESPVAWTESELAASAIVRMLNELPPNLASEAVNAFARSVLVEVVRRDALGLGPYRPPGYHHFAD